MSWRCSWTIYVNRSKLGVYPTKRLPLEFSARQRFRKLSIRSPSNAKQRSRLEHYSTVGDEPNPCRHTRARSRSKHVECNSSTSNYILSGPWCTGASIFSMQALISGGPKLFLRTQGREGGREVARTKPAMHATRLYSFNLNYVSSHPVYRVKSHISFERYKVIFPLTELKLKHSVSWQPG